MSDLERFYSQLPERTRGRLKSFIAGLQTELGTKLSGALVHGSAARGGWREGSDVDVVLVLADDSPAVLSAIAPHITLAESSDRIECILLHAAEIARAADVFPLLYSDIQRCHVLLHGENPFKGLVVEARHVRLRVEQELRDAKIRLRRLVVEEGESPRLGRAIERKIKQLRSPLHALLRLSGQDGSDELARVLKDCGALLKVDTAPLAQVRELPAQALTALRALLDAAIARVDGMEQA